MDPTYPGWRRLPWLVAGSVLLACAQGHWPIPLAALLAPVMLLRFTRHTSAWLGLPLLVAAHVAVWEVAYRGMVPLPLAARLGMELAVSLVFGGVFAMDRWTSRRSSAFWATCVFPCGWVVFDFASARLSPGGTWGSVAYTFSDQLYFVQVASLLGWTSLTFCVAWIAAVTNWWWDRNWSRDGQSGVWATALVLGLLVVFGACRVHLVAPSPPQTRVACVVAPSTFEGPHFEELWRYTRGVEQSSESNEKARRQIQSSRSQHFELVEREARAGARLIVWAEANAVLTVEEEPAWTTQAQEMARAYGVYIGMGLSVFRPSPRQKTLNKFVLAGPDGEILWEFLKATRVPGAYQEVGDGVLPVVDSELGRLSPAICFDMDFPQLIRQVGCHQADLLLAPSNDWTEAKVTHARMAAMRAIENGTSLVRPTKDGISLVTDPLGRTIARLDTDAGGEQVTVAVVPTQGRPTLYRRVGDILPWTAIAFLLAASVALFRAGPCQTGLRPSQLPRPGPSVWDGGPRV